MRQRRGRAAWRTRLRVPRRLLPWIALTAIAVAAGTYARFHGLGTWPLAVDEYYIARSVQNVLRFGLPDYACGGLYTRGLLFQYLVAPLQLAGMSAELSARLIAALCSLISLPAVYLIGRRLRGPVLGLAGVTIIALSVWEVEIARFGRMYAPFQAEFLWYVVFFLRYTLDRERRALWPMLALTIAAALTWEGGVFLAAANLLPLLVNNRRGRFSGADWLHFAAFALLTVGIFRFVSAEPRFASGLPALPAGFNPDTARLPAPHALRALWTTLADHRLWLLAALAPLAAAKFALRDIWRLRARWLTACGLAAALGAALLGQFLAFGIILILLLLTGLLRRTELAPRNSAPFFVAVGISLAFWVAFGLATSDWRAGAQPATFLGSHTLLWLAYELLRVPELIRVVAVPWGGAIPILSAGLFVLLSAAIVHAIAREDADDTAAARVLLVVLVCMLAAAGAAHPPRLETRYVFFLYPLALLIAADMVIRAALLLGRQRTAAASVGALAALALFTTTEDFNARHLFAVASARVNFRMDVTGRLAAHLLPRVDVRGAAQWLDRHAVSGDNVVINAFPSVDFYYHHFDFAYMNEHDPRFEAYSCDRGSIERWGNLPLLYSAAALQAHVARGGTALLVISSSAAPTLLPPLAPLHPRVLWTSIDGGVTILELRRRASSAPDASAQAATG